ncbi:hypothetical protein HDV00_009142 [Rhizophlyctis rosea]|nr:hypothetical protein HDV00_009142 [Rhizophlyctis rosea]
METPRVRAGLVGAAFPLSFSVGDAREVADESPEFRFHIEETLSRLRTVRVGATGSGLIAPERGLLRTGLVALARAAVLAAAAASSALSFFHIELMLSRFLNGRAGGSSAGGAVLAETLGLRPRATIVPFPVPMSPTPATTLFLLPDAFPLSAPALDPAAPTLLFGSLPELGAAPEFANTAALRRAAASGGATDTSPVLIDFLRPRESCAGFGRVPSSRKIVERCLDRVESRLDDVDDVTGPLDILDGLEGRAVRPSSAKIPGPTLFLFFFLSSIFCRSVAELRAARSLADIPNSAESGRLGRLFALARELVLVC